MLENIMLGFSQLGWESAWRLANSESIKEAAERAGVSLMYENAEQKQDRHKSDCTFTLHNNLLF